MATRRFQNATEAAYADHLTQIGLSYQYEKPWGKTNPDFTIERAGAPPETIALADVKELRQSDKNEARLAADEVIHIERNPAARTRRQIFNVRRQFEAGADYPCILVLAPAGDWLPEPVSVMAAMLGDLTLSVPVSAAVPAGAGGIWSFRGNGKMVDREGDAQNTLLTAIGLLSRIRPGEVLSGYSDKIRELADQFLAEGLGDEAMGQYLEACTNLKAALTAEDYDLETAAMQVEYVVNPFAAKPFPKANLARGYVKVWEYDLKTQMFSVTYDWTKRDDSR